MILKHLEWEFTFSFHENQIQWLVMEEPSVYRALVCDMKNQCRGESGGFVLSEGEKIISISSRLSLVTDPFDIDINNRKVVTNLYKSLVALSMEEGYYLTTQETMSRVFRYFEELFSEFHHSLAFDYEVDMDKIFKACGVGFETEGESFLELLLDYTRIMMEFGGADVFVFCNLANCLMESELSDLIASWHSAKVPVLLIDTVAPALEIEMNRWIIDMDKCLIHG